MTLGQITTVSITFTGHTANPVNKDFHLYIIIHLILPLTCVVVGTSDVQMYHCNLATAAGIALHR